MHKKPKSKPIIEKFDGKDVIIGGVLATNLECLGGGDRGVAFTANAQGKDVIVRMIHNKRQIMRVAAKDKLYSNFFGQISANGDTTGADSFTPQISEGFTEEMPKVYAEIWSKATGQSVLQLSNSGVGFRTPEEFMEFAKKACESIMFMWSVGMRHGDFQRENVMWDHDAHAVHLIDYENFEEVEPDGFNNDVTWLITLFQKINDDFDIKELYGQKAAAMVHDLKKHEGYRYSLDNFKKFYTTHFTGNIKLPEKI
jgi:hypothetical protein